MYRILLRLYPADFAAALADEMLEASQRRPAAGELAGLALGIATEWFAKLTTDRATRGRCLPDLRMMRPAGVSKEDWFRSC